MRSSSYLLNYVLLATITYKEANDFDSVISYQPEMLRRLRLLGLFLTDDKRYVKQLTAVR